jgi:hypothetical protein
VWLQKITTQRVKRNEIKFIKIKCVGIQYNVLCWSHGVYAPGCAERRIVESLEYSNTPPQRLCSFNSPLRNAVFASKW